MTLYLLQLISIELTRSFYIWGYGALIPSANLTGILRKQNYRTELHMKKHYEGEEMRAFPKLKEVAISYKVVVVLK